MSVKFTKEEREGWIKFCEEVANDFGIEHDDFNKLSDEELDKVSDFYHELTLK